MKTLLALIHFSTVSTWQKRHHTEPRPTDACARWQETHRNKDIAIYRGQVNEASLCLHSYTTLYTVLLPAASACDEAPATAATFFSSSGLLAPTSLSTCCPFLRKKNVGVARMSHDELNSCGSKLRKGQLMYVCKTQFLMISKTFVLYLDM